MANYSYNGNGDLQLFGKGADIWQDQTQYNWYCKKESNVDIDQVCLVESQQNTNSFAKAGCLIHNGMPSVAAHAAIWICIVPNGSIVVLSKASNGQVQQLKSVDGKAVPVWLRVQKTGLSVKLYYSTDSPTTTAIAWVLLHEVQNFFSGFGTDYWHGVFGCSHTTDTTSEIKFKHILDGAGSVIAPTPDSSGQTNNRRLFVLLGSSIMGGRAANSGAPTGDIRAYNRIKILNNNTMVVENLSIGVNSDLADNESIANTHGIELYIAKAIENNVFDQNDAYLLKIAQGGAFVGQFTAGLGYADTMLQRIDAMKAAIAAAGRTFTPYVVVELAVNDSANHEAIGVTPSIYYDRLTNLLGRVRAKLGLSTHIIICRPWADFGYFNATIDTIVSENPYNHSVDISGAARFDGVHPNYAGNQVIGQLVISKIQSIEAVANPVIPTAPDSGGGTSTEAFRIVNTVVTDSPQYNQILVDAVPDFNIPNNTAGEPFFQIIFCTGGRNQFGLDKLYKRGFSTPTVSACVQPSEFDGSYPHANPAYVSTLPFFRRSFWTGTGWMNSAPFNLHIDAGDHTLDYFEDNGNSSYQQAILQGFGAKGYGFGDPATPNYLLNAKTILLDMENWGGFTNGLDDLEFRARHYGWLYYLMQASTSNCWVNTMYPTCPVFTFGRPNLNHYTNAGRNALWYQPVQSTSNLTAKKMPSAFVGQKVADLARVSAFTETYFEYETFLPEGSIIKNKKGNNLPAVTHYGTNPNGGHWATQACGNPEVQFYQLLQDGKSNPVVHEISYMNLGGTGYKNYGENGASNYEDVTIDRYRAGFIEPVPALIAEGQVLLTLFTGAWINLWHDPAPDINPVAKDGATLSNLVKDMSGFNYILKAFYRFFAAKTTIASSLYGISDLLDANTEFLRWNTKVSYDSGSTFVQYKAPEWQINQKTAVRAIVNRPKNLIAIYAVQPYGVEQSSVIVKYDQNGYNWQRQIDVRAGVNELYIFKLNDI